MTTAADSRYRCPSPRTTATADQTQAATVPSETRVSMVLAPWRALTAAARWNCQPHHQTTTPDSNSDHHSQPGTRVAGTMPQSTTGTESTTATSSRTGRGVGVCWSVGAGRVAS